MEPSEYNQAPIGREAFSFRKNGVLVPVLLAMLLSLFTTACIFWPTAVWEWKWSGDKDDTFRCTDMFVIWIPAAALAIFPLLYACMDSIRHWILLLFGVIGELARLGTQGLLLFFVGNEGRPIFRTHLTLFGWLAFVLGLANVILQVVLIVKTRRRLKEIRKTAPDDAAERMNRKQKGMRTYGPGRI